ncbi:hypothetical protein PTSG_01150 [Salpingoeca rosetta]|uniref:ER membrane protein complex subunit 2 n=1 Tax=Salpingoeca rosetta (strain ATCC 50818 / BSB-021) TaxID=946362 RepID=F2U0Y4_SALR5|nr:uncharacterized protein PTSG_01150 [Salpingoeca rosetta]EGD80558.1 hypothetical protein PTSG_01150 [Salpingoeca rosetta]|eukprot:XP_004997119.1 hypothetical protein PTSG_01150 [Salpingoeca rosetta]
MEELRELQRSHERKSMRIVAIARQNWSAVMGSGDEKWGFLEQIFTASLDMPNAEDVRKRCLQALEKRFPNSQRVQRLQAMGFEADGQFQKALDIYNEMLEADPLNPAILKRKIAVHIGKDDIPLAITALNKYLELYSSDFEAWQQLTDLYIDTQDLQNAAFCLEEVMLSNPHNHVYYCTYAEVLFARGGSERMTQARRYFAKALELNPTSARALYGLHLASARTMTKGSKASEDVATVADLRDGSKEQLLALYEEQGANPTHQALLPSVLVGSGKQ